ncbi:hypothetical protein ABIB57_005312 [Devosia sp. UYZn731]|uniref:DUF930 domain-containing protein n=1 Tax=Devosia sp. UYZn731 TaxID=3156345 RepID=UPI0033992694
MVADRMRGPIPTRRPDVLGTLHVVVFARQMRSLPFLVSICIHAAVLAALLLLVTSEKLPVPRPRAVDVDIITEQQFRSATLPPAPIAIPTPRMPPAVLSTPAETVPAPAMPPTLEPVLTTENGGMTTATQFFTSRILDDPKNRQVKQTLPRLGPEERIIQLCNIEGLEQLRLVSAGKVPDSLDPSAMADTTITGDTLDAPGGAYRLHKKWYSVSFTCKVGLDRQSVIDFKFKLGAAIPHNQWDSHNLIDDDIELD